MHDRWRWGTSNGPPHLPTNYQIDNQQCICIFSALTQGPDTEEGVKIMEEGVKITDKWVNMPENGVKMMENGVKMKEKEIKLADNGVK